MYKNVTTIRTTNISPQKLKTVLKHINDKDKNIDIFIKAIKKNEYLANKKVTGYVNKGSAAIVFETSDGKILKLTEGNHFPLNRPQEEFDVPIYEKGKIGNIHYYIEEKLYQHGLSTPFVEEIKERIKKRGYKTFDIYDTDTNQIGLSKEGKLYLLDPECARYKTIFHALIDKTKKIIRRIL